jgi:hypothetical protein
MSVYCAEVLSSGSDSRARESDPGVGVAGTGSMPEVKLLLIRETPEGFFLERRTESGEAAGDTQYETLDDAVRFAHSEYDPISDWRFCPDDVDPLEFIRARSDP